MGAEEVEFVVVNSDSSDSMKQSGKQFAITTKNHGNVVLKLCRPVIVHSIQFTNHKSAFVEVLASSPKLYSQFNPKVLVPVCSVLSPENSRALKKCDRSIELKRDRFVGGCRSLPVDHIQIMCSQPFNKNIPFGIEDIHVYGKSPKNDSNSQVDLKPKMGKFQYYTNDKKNIFNTQENLFDSYDLEYKKNLIKLYEKKSEKVVSNDDIKKEEEEEVEEKKVKTKTPVSGRGKKVKTESADRINEDPRRKTKIEIKEEKDTLKGRASSAKSDILAGIVFSLSGYENPQRSQLRDMAVGMGAHYQSKWDEDSTHLICAFASTPKYSEVQRLNGRIVTEKWIMDCHKKGKLLKWQNYELKGDDTSPEKTAKTSKTDTKDNNDNSVRMIDTNGRHDPNADKDRKRKAVKKDSETGSGSKNAENDGTVSLATKRPHNAEEDGDERDEKKRHGKRKKQEQDDETTASAQHSRQTDSKKIYAAECDSDVIYDQDTDDELLSGR